MLRILLLSLYLIASALGVYAQNKASIDSLKNMLQTNINEQQKVDTYNLLAKEYSYTDSAKVAQYTSKAITISKKNNYPAGIADAYYYLGWITMIKGHYPAALRLFEHIKEIAQKSDYKRGMGYFYQGTGNVHYRLGDYTKALQFYQKSLKTNKEIDFQWGMAWTYNDMAIIYYLKGDYPKALQMFGESLKINEKIGDQKGVAGCFNNLGIVYDVQGDYLHALEMYQQSLKIKEQIGDKNGMMNSYHNIAAIYNLQKDYSKALQFYQKALKINLQIGNQKGTATIYNNIGIIYREQRNYSKALEMQQKALKIHEQIGNKSGIAFDYLGIGQVYLDKKQADKAKVYFEKALKLRQQMGEKGLSAKVWVELGIAYYVLGDYAKAQSHLEKAMNLTQDLGNLIIIRDGAKHLAKIYELKGQYQKALKNHILFKKMADSLFNAEKTKKITRLEDEYLFNKEKDSLKYAQAKAETVLKSRLREEKLINRFQRRLSWSALLVIGIIGVFAVIMFRGKQQQKKLNIILNQKSQALELKSKELGVLNKELRQSQDEIIAQRDFIEVQNQKLLDSKRHTDQSIRAARSIQRAILPFEDRLRNIFDDFFILYRPKDVVSGDFYWVNEIDGKKLIAAVDCTGHGVPGAFMSMIGNTLLNNLIKFKHIYNPAQVLEMLHEEIQLVLRQHTSNDHSGMDIGLCMIEDSQEAAQVKVTFAGAKRPLFYIAKEETNLRQLKGTKKSIGGHQREDISFVNQHVFLNKGSKLYLGSDGYTDQNNKVRRKIGTESFVAFLEEIHHQPLYTQRDLLEQKLLEHMMDTEQRDDILLIGVQV
ncbi:hypothetical protein BKI52_02960 [marine bacterium AO1-C]|nr:hypothetical protein BKI52_02960 [marine bacterium AO1-C]